MELGLGNSMEKALLKGCLWLETHDQDSEGSYYEYGECRRLRKILGIFARRGNSKQFVHF